MKNADFLSYQDNDLRWQKHQSILWKSVSLKYIMIVKYISMSIVVASLISCSGAPKIVSLKSSIDRMEVKIKNPQESKQYILRSSMIRSYPIDTNFIDSDGIINFDISKSEKDIRECFLISDGDKKIYIDGNTYAFYNPAVKKSLILKKKLEEEYSSFQKKKILLDNNYSNRNGECVFLTSNFQPEKPSNACSPQESSTFSRQQCQNTSSKSGVVDRIGNSLFCGVVGIGVGYFTGGLGGLAAGAACDLYMDDQDKNNQYNNCLKNSVNNCTYYYNNWITSINDIKHNPEKIHQECIQNRKAIKSLTEIIDNLNIEFNNLSRSYVSITKSDYCYER